MKIYKVSAQGLEELEVDSVSEHTVTILGIRRNKVSHHPLIMYFTDLRRAVEKANMMNAEALYEAQTKVDDLCNAAKNILEWAQLIEEKNDEFIR